VRLSKQKRPRRWLQHRQRARLHAGTDGAEVAHNIPQKAAPVNFRRGRFFVPDRLPERSANGFHPLRDSGPLHSSSILPVSPGSSPLIPPRIPRFPRRRSTDHFLLFKGPAGCAQPGCGAGKHICLAQCRRGCRSLSSACPYALAVPGRSGRRTRPGAGGWE